MWWKHLLRPLGLSSALLLTLVASHDAVPALSARTFVDSGHPGAAAARPPAVLLNSTQPCDSPSELAEDCRLTLAGACDPSLGQRPTCQAGTCQCLAKACLSGATCAAARQCRRDDEEPFCSARGVVGPSGAPFLGVCGCRPRVAGCSGARDPKITIQDLDGKADMNVKAAQVEEHRKDRNEDGNGDDIGHLWCAARVRCSEHFFSAYPEHAVCEAAPGTGRGGAGGGVCRCKVVDCAASGGPADWETCKGLVDCGRLRPYCNAKWSGGHRKEDGYCTCV